MGLWDRTDYFGSTGPEMEEDLEVEQGQTGQRGGIGGITERPRGKNEYGIFRV